jgi:hypothetical protein
MRLEEETRRDARTTPVSAPRMCFYYAYVHLCTVETRTRTGL